MEQENNRLEELEKKAEEYLNNWKRAAADFINYKKEEMERLVSLMQHSKENMIEKFLPVIDSIYLLDKHAKVEGIDAIKKQIEEFLKKEEIEEIVVEGKEFDPATMEAIGESESGQLEEMQKGYMVHGKVLRPAKVKVNK